MELKLTICDMQMSLDLCRIELRVSNFSWIKFKWSTHLNILDSNFTSHKKNIYFIWYCYCWLWTQNGSRQHPTTSTECWLGPFNRNNITNHICATEESFLLNMELKMRVVYCHVFSISSVYKTVFGLRKATLKRQEPILMLITNRTRK